MIVRSLSSVRRALALKVSTQRDLRRASHSNLKKRDDEEKTHFLKIMLKLTKEEDANLALVILNQQLWLMKRNSQILRQ